MSEEKKVGEANAGATPAREVKPPSLDAMRFVHNWLFESGEAEMWPAANLRDAARMVDAFSARNPEQSAALSALTDWRKAERALFIARTVVTEMGGDGVANYRARREAQEELNRCLSAERERRTLAMSAADSLSPVEAEEAKADE